MTNFASITVSVFLLSASSAPAAWAQEAAAEDLRAAADIARRILRADYEGDRAALRRLSDAVPPIPDDSRLASRLLYWRGFALWRRAINGFNESVAADEQTADVRAAARDFDESIRRDPLWAEARIGRLSSVQLLLALGPGDADTVRDLAGQYRARLAELERIAPENPRLHWVRGPSEWYAPPGTPPEQVATRQATALATYERGLRLARAHKGTTVDPLEPSWAEPELLMSLAWSHLNRTVPDLRAAETHARQALALVPYWHYVRDILVPQIERARPRER